MSTPLDSLVTLSARTEEAAGAAVRGWADGVQALAGAQGTLASLPDLYARSFDAVRTLLASQRQAANALVNAAQATQSVTNQVTRTAEQALDALHEAMNGVASLAAIGGEQAEAAARAARSVRN